MALLLFLGFVFQMQAWLPPALSAPEDGAILTIPNPCFQWSEAIVPDVAAMGSYQIEIAADEDFMEMVDEDEIAATVCWYVPNRLFDYGETYHWRVFPVDAEGHRGPPSPAQRFSIIAEPPVHPVALGTDFAGLKSILAAAAAQAPAIVRFAQGTHVFDPGNDTSIIDLRDASDLVIEGAGTGADIVSTRKVSFLNANNCRRILYSNLTFDVAPLFYTAGLVVALDEANATIDIAIEPGHPALESDPDLANANVFFPMQGSPPKISTDADGVVFQYIWTSLGSGRYRLALANPGQISEIGIGDVAVIEPGRFGFCWAVRSEDIVYHKITAYSAGNDFVGKYADRLRLLGSGFSLKPGRYITCVAGAGNFHDCRLGPWMEGCVVENVSDDGPNANCTARGANRQIDSRTVDLFRMTNAVETPADPEKVFAPGDAVLVLDPATGDYVEHSVDGSSYETYDGRTCIRVRFTTEVAGIRFGNTNEDSLATRFINLDRNSAGYVQRFNTYRNVQRNPLLVSCKGGLIEHCTITGSGGRGLVASGPYLPQFWRVSNLVVRNVEMEDVGRLNGLARNSPVLFRKIGLGAMNEQGRAFHKNVLFENLRFTDCPTPHYDLTSTENVVVQ